MMLAPAPANSSYEFVCAESCPLQGPFTSEADIGGHDAQSTKTKYLGRQSVTQEGGSSKTKVCDHWHWSELLLHVLPLSTTDFYVDTSGSPAVPFFSTQSEFGKIFNVHYNSSFLSFLPAGNLTDRFNIDPSSFANCPKSGGCSGSATTVGNTFGDGSAASPAYEPASSQGLVFRATPVPAFAASYTSVEETRLVENTGGTTIGGAVCCIAADTRTANGECLVTTAHQAGTRFYDHAGQRVRFEDTVAGVTSVTFYNNISKQYGGGMDIVVNVTNGVETCQSFCPLLPGETLDPFAPIDPNASDVGAATINGKAVEHFEWSDYDKVPIVGRVKMDTVEFYVTPGLNPVPVFSVTKITPYNGPQSGTQNTTWTKFTSGTPPAAKFNIAGIDECPQAKNCQIETVARSAALRRSARRYSSAFFLQEL